MLPPTCSDLFNKDHVSTYISDENSGVYSKSEEQQDPSWPPRNDPLRPIDVFSRITFLVGDPPPSPPGNPRPRGPIYPQPDGPTPPASP
ncbi:hypothetical protein CSAL01_04621 [Colletotrichum salicis]|uniref:Uncharacterized protein n=1 Tax=Colletotrichum salicis TaxID=1209931 RepID=A0A135UP28_9PEZI|nr:hypothetical protein CSAL01_04621 [Colletotrichum salicis]